MSTRRIFLFIFLTLWTIPGASPAEVPDQKKLQAQLEAEVAKRFTLVPDLTRRHVELPLSKTTFDVKEWGRLSRLSLDDLFDTIALPPYNLPVVKLELPVEDRTGLEEIKPAVLDGDELSEANLLKSLPLIADPKIRSFYLPPGATLYKKPEAFAEEIKVENAKLIVKSWGSRARVLHHLAEHLAFKRSAFHVAAERFREKVPVMMDVTVDDLKEFLKEHELTLAKNYRLTEDEVSDLLHSTSYSLQTAKFLFTRVEVAWFFFHYAHYLEGNFSRADQLTQVRRSSELLLEYAQAIGKNADLRWLEAHIREYPTKLRDEYALLVKDIGYTLVLQLYAAAKIRQQMETALPTK